MADKQELRRVYLEKRLCLSQSEFDHRNQQLRTRVLGFLSEIDFNIIHTFLPIIRQKEVNTQAIVDALKEKNPETCFYISKTLPQGILEHFEWSRSTILENNKWGIPEPINGPPADISNIDAIFVPLIVFDKKGHRIGYGKGYYDRFLLQCPHALKIGLTLGPPLDIIPYVEDTDIKLDYCISPFEVYKF